MEDEPRETTASVGLSDSERLSITIGATTISMSRATARWVCKELARWIFLLTGGTGLWALAEYFGIMDFLGG